MVRFESEFSSAVALSCPDNSMLVQLRNSPCPMTGNRTTVRPE